MNVKKNVHVDEVRFYRPVTINTVARARIKKILQPLQVSKAPEEVRLECRGLELVRPDLFLGHFLCILRL